eukprot:5710110-Pyramimonas_sp.AAC.1
MHRLLHGKGAGVMDLIKTPSGHLAMTVDEYGFATEAHGSTASTATANPRREETPAHIKEVADVEPMARQAAFSNAGAPATNDANTYM